MDPQEVKANLISCTKEGNLKMIKEINEIHDLKDYYQYIVPIAAGYDQIEILEFLKNEGYDLTVHDNNAFGNACRYNRGRIIKYLLEVHPEINIRSQNYYGFCWACKNGHKDIVKQLLELGIEANARENLPLRVAVESNYYDVAKLLIKYGAVPPKKYSNYFRLWVAQQGNIKMAKLLEENGLDFNAQLNAKNDFHIKSADKNYFDYVKYLIEEKGFDIHINADKLLSIAVFNENEEYVEYFDKKGLNWKQREGICLVYAARKGNISLVRKCLEKGIDPSSNKFKALLLSSSEKHFDVTLYLWNKIGADKIPDSTKEKLFRNGFKLPNKLSLNNTSHN